MTPPPDEVTALLERLQQGDLRAGDDLMPLVYEELRGLAARRMAREAPGQTLQPTALVHEAWLRLGGDRQPSWQSRRHFFGAAAEAMRRILIDRARRRQARAAAGLAEPEEIHESRLQARAPDDELLAVDAALERLARVDGPAAALVKLRYFAGLDMAGAAAALGLSLRQTERLWTFARAWLRGALRREG